MQSFAGAETTRRFSSTLNSTWPMTRRQPKYPGRKAHRRRGALAQLVGLAGVRAIARKSRRQRF